jgi:hypothetical protein
MRRYPKSITTKLIVQRLPCKSAVKVKLIYCGSWAEVVLKGLLYAGFFKMEWQLKFSLIEQEL